MTKVSTCGVPSLTLGPCDLPKNHEKEMHASAGDGFHANCWLCRQPLLSEKWTRKTGVLGFICLRCK